MRPRPLLATNCLEKRWVTSRRFVAPLSSSVTSCLTQLKLGLEAKLIDIKAHLVKADTEREKRELLGIVSSLKGEAASQDGV